MQWRTENGQGYVREQQGTPRSRGHAAPPVACPAQPQTSAAKPAPMTLTSLHLTPTATFSNLQLHSCQQPPDASSWSCTIIRLSDGQHCGVQQQEVDITCSHATPRPFKWAMLSKPTRQQGRTASSSTESIQASLVIGDTSAARRGGCPPTRIQLPTLRARASQDCTPQERPCDKI